LVANGDGVRSGGWLRRSTNAEIHDGGNILAIIAATVLVIAQPIEDLTTCKQLLNQFDY
jgi:hypothetical protein